MHDLVREEVATKADFAEVRADVEAVRRDLKRDIQEAEARLRAEIRRVGPQPGDKFGEAADRLVARLDAMERRITIKLGAITLASVIVSVTVVKLL